MEIQVLGPVCLVNEGRRHAIARHQARAILALLSLTPGTPQPFERIQEELWAAAPLSNSRNAMQAAVARLRKVLAAVGGRSGKQFVRTADGGYLLDLPADVVDAHRFLGLAERGAALRHTAPATAARLLTEALGLWHGQALADVGDALAFRIEATHLDERRVTALEDLMAARLALGGSAALLGELRRLTAKHPERERFSEQLMVALYRCGRQVEALDVFHSVRRRLDAELGLAPGRGLRELYEAILVQDKVLG